MTDPHLYDIAVVAPSVGVFGGVRRFVEIGNELVRRGHAYTIYHPGGDPPEWLPFSGETRPLDALAGARHQVLICNDPPLFERFRDTPADARLFYFALERIPHERAIVRSGWTMLANSEGIYRYLRRRYRAGVERVVGGINLDVFAPRNVERDDDTFRIATFGRMSRRRKGTHLVVSAVESTVQRGGDVVLVLYDHVGPGNPDDPRARLHTDVQHEWHLNLSQPDLVGLYCGCDLVVSAEKKAGWNNTVAEAMACGVPVVCTRSGTLDLAVPGETAWVLRFRHPWFLRRGIEVVRGDIALAQRLRDAALRRVRQFSWPRVADRLLEVIGDKLGVGA